MPDDNRLLVETNPTPGRRAGFLAQHRVKGTLYNEPTEGQNGHQSVRSDDGQFATFGATTDAESTTGNGTFIALLKRVRTLLTAVFEAVITLGQAIGTAKAILVAGSDGTNLRAISTTNTGAVNTVLAGSNVQDVTFHNGATVVASGTVLTVGGYKILTVEVSGTSTSRNIEFMARGPAGINRPIMGIRLNDLATSASTNSTGEIWQFDISGLSSVLMNLADVVGGNVTVQGKVMA